ncbi:sugar ABC transporter substrate-binding protein, partial [Microbacterium lacticum]|uniref:sugar ABC transporter substrate-binding protein n=1 Tax=Microbacterium lacticum TaxID=33885 RepID=UPI003A8663CD
KVAPNPNIQWHPTTQSRQRPGGPEPQYQWPSEERILSYSAVFLQDPAQAAQVEQFDKETESRGLEALSPTSANGDAGTQDSDIRNLVTAGAKSLMVIPADPSAVVPALDYAAAQGLKIVSLMLGPTGGKVDVSMQVDNYAIGEEACEFLAEKVGDSGTLLHVQGDMRAVTAQQRDAGFQDCVKANYPNITLIVKSGGQWDPVTAASSVAAVLISNPDLGGIFMASDGYVDSVAQTLSSAGKSAAAGEDGHVWTVSVDGTPSALDAIRNGKLDASAAQPITEFVTYGLDYLELLGDGGELSVGPTDHGSEIVETDDGYLADVFPAVFITKDTVDDDSNWANTVG